MNEPQFDPQEAERLVEKLESRAPYAAYLEEPAAMLRVAVKEIKDLSRWKTTNAHFRALEAKLEKAERVIAAAREAYDLMEGFAYAPLDQALEEYDHTE